MDKKNISEKVLNFYKKLPFNIHSDIDASVKQIKKWDPLEVYPELKKIVDKFEKINIIDFGCGGGWLVNSLSYHHGNKINITGVDFNPIAIEYANQTKNKCKINSNFIISDLNKFTTVENFDLIISLGVLHHTNNCLEALKYICKFGNKNSYLFLGLYHKYGREPFLKHFSDMKDKSEDYKFEEYKKLHKNITDKKKLYSWFRDQVLNVHETQHTFKEISQLLINLEYSIIFTSINKFKKINNLKDIYELEKECFNISLQKLKQKEYYPGFFITIAKK